MNFPEYFAEDIRTNDTNLIPLVVFDDLDLNISTNRVQLGVQKTYHYENHSSIWLDNVFEHHFDKWFDPLLLNIPRITNAFERNQGKIKESSVQLEISNIKHNGKRFSDILADRSLINEKVSIFWKSQSTNKLSTGFIYQVKMWGFKFLLI